MVKEDLKEMVEMATPATGNVPSGQPTVSTPPVAPTPAPTGDTVTETATTVKEDVAPVLDRQANVDKWEKFILKEYNGDAMSLLAEIPFEEFVEELQDQVQGFDPNIVTASTAPDEVDPEFQAMLDERYAQI